MKEKTRIAQDRESCERDWKRIGSYVSGGKMEQAFSILTHLANAGYGPALMMIAEWYKNGTYVKQSFHKAADYAGRAVEIQTEGAAEELQNLNRLAALKEQAKSEDAQALVELGEIYELGQLIRQDTAKAVEYYIRALGQNSLIAFRNLSHLCDQGNPDALYAMLLLRQDKNSGYYDQEGTCDIAVHLLTLSGGEKRCEEFHQLLTKEAESQNLYAAYVYGKYLLCYGSSQMEWERGISYLRKSETAAGKEVQIALAAAAYLGRGMGQEQGTAVRILETLGEQPEYQQQFDQMIAVIAGLGDESARIYEARKALYEGTDSMDHKEAADLLESVLTTEEAKDRLVLASYYRENQPEKAAGFLFMVGQLLEQKTIEFSEQEELYYYVLSFEVELQLRPLEQTGTSSLTSQEPLWKALTGLVSYQMKNPDNQLWQTEIFQAAGYLLSCYFYGNADGKNYSDAIPLFSMAYDRGMLSPEELRNYAFCRLHGLGCDKDVALAMKLYQESADLGDPAAACQIGNCYRYGYNGYPQDPQKGADYYEISAGAENPDALFALSLCYDMGVGRPKDVHLASELLQQAVKAGSAEAVEELEKKKMKEISLDLAFSPKKKEGSEKSGIFGNFLRKKKE